MISQTTSQYPLKHTETTQEEIAVPGKLPETPLRMDPDLLYDVRYDDEFEDREPSRMDQIQMKSLPSEPISSYSVSQVMLEPADDMQYVPIPDVSNSHSRKVTNRRVDLLCWARRISRLQRNQVVFVIL